MNIVVKIYIPKVNFIMVFVIFNIDCFLEENSFATDFNILFFCGRGEKSIRYSGSSGSEEPGTWWFH